jgi:hypothetical protein
LREHVQKNFSERASYLDKMADFGIDMLGPDWYKRTVPIHKHPGATEAPVANGKFSTLLGE